MESFLYLVTLNNSMYLEVLNSTSIKLILKKPPTSYSTSTDSKEIVELVIDDLKIQTNKTAISFKLLGKDMVYKISKIESLSDTKFILSTPSVGNKTTYFMLPTLGVNKDLLYYSRYLVNAYISDDIRKEELWLLYRYFPSNQFRSLEKYLSKHLRFVGFKDCDYNFTILSFKLDDRELEQVKLFVSGKYSELDDKLKKDILKFHNLDYNSKTYGILYKTDARRKQLELDLDASIKPTLELYDKPIITREVFVPYRDTNINISNYDLITI